MTFLLDLWLAKGREPGAGLILLDATILEIRHKLELTGVHFLNQFPPRIPSLEKFYY